MAKTERMWALINPWREVRRLRRLLNEANFDRADLVKQLNARSQRLFDLDKRMRQLETETAQLRRGSLSDEDAKALEHFRETGEVVDDFDPKSALIAGDNAQASEVKNRQLKTVNQGLRVVIRNMIINFAVARTLPAGSNERGEIEADTLVEALQHTDLPSVAEAAAIGTNALHLPPEERGFEPETEAANADPCPHCGQIHGPFLCDGTSKQPQIFGNGDGVSKDWTITFPYISPGRIRVFVDGVCLVRGKDYLVSSPSRPGGGEVSFKVPPPKGKDNILITRRPDPEAS